MDDPEWWKKNPCPQHPDWGLHDISDLDHAKLKLHIDQDENAVSDMPIEVNIYRAALEYLDGKGTLYNRSRDSPTKALIFLQRAKEIVATSGESEEAITGYGVVINTFRMWLRPDSSVEATLKELEEKKKQFPKYEAYVTIVHAYILSRLGPRWIKKAIGLFEDALSDFPENPQWLFGLALMIGRDARQQRGVVGWNISLPNNIRILFQKEKDYLEQVLTIDSQYHLARAYYGQVLFNLNSDSRIQAEHELRQALQSDRTNTKIRILVAKFYRLNDPFLPQAENMLKELIKDVNLAEVHAQLGFLYRSRSYREAEMENHFVLYQKALECFQNAVKVDSCHYAALVGFGEMQANLGKVQEALTIYHDLFMGDFKDKPHQEYNEYIALTSAIKLTIFTSLEHVTFSHRIIQLVVGFTADGDHIMTLPPPSFDETKRRCLTTLKKYSTQSDGDSNLTCQAKLKLANAYLGNIDKAQRQYGMLYDDIASQDEVHQVEVIFGLGKCYLRSGIQSMESDSEAWATVYKMAEELKARNSSILSDELYADVYLAKANCITGGGTAELLKLAIQKDSLEACYRYISRQELKENFFNDISIPETLEEVKRVCSVGKPLHTQFTVILDNGSEVVHNLTAKKNFIQAAVDRVVNYDINITQTIENERLQTVLDKLRELREYRMKYELELRRSRENNKWGKEYEKRLFDVVKHVQSLLDKCISACQGLVVTNLRRNSSFIVVFDCKEGKVDTKQCTNEVMSWARKKVKLPEYLLGKIAKIQPMYDKKNMWLKAIQELGNLDKHSAVRCDIGETFTIKVHSDPKFITLKTDDIVKDSCKGVVKLVVCLLKTCCKKSSGAAAVAGAP